MLTDSRISSTSCCVRSPVPTELLSPESDTSDLTMPSPAQPSPAQPASTFQCAEPTGCTPTHREGAHRNREGGESERFAPKATENNVSMGQASLARIRRDARTNERASGRGDGRPPLPPLAVRGMKEAWRSQFHPAIRRQRTRQQKNTQASHER